MQITLKDFLKKFTAIPEKFINEYYEFYELCQNNKFGIPIEQVLKYLELNSQEKIEQRLRTEFKINIDYIIIRLNQKLTKGKKDANYMISFECFEKIAMNSRTKKGSMFRDYFVMLRKFIDYYKNHFADKIMELTKTNKFIYILLANKNYNILKLGRTKDMRKRLQSYATGKDIHPDIKFIMIVNDDKKVEQCTKLFAKVNQYKGNKELYKMNSDKLKEIIFDCAKIDSNIHNQMINNNNDLDTYVVYDDSKTIEYLNLNGDVIGFEKNNSLKKKTNNSIKNYSKKITKKKLTHK